MNLGFYAWVPCELSIVLIQTWSQISKRLSSTNHPAVITVPDMVAAKHWLKLMKAEQNKSMESMKYQILQLTLEINPRYEPHLGQHACIDWCNVQWYDTILWVRNALIIYKYEAMIARDVI